MTDLLYWGLMAVALTSAVVGGVFLAFSDFVMPSLAAASPRAGSEAMQVINRRVYRSLFIVLLVGLIPVTALIGLAALALPWGAASAPLLAGGAVYLAGVWIASAVGNIPMNRRLDALPTAEAAALAYWPDYQRGWRWWNHLRSVSAISCALLFVVAARLL